MIRKLLLATAMLVFCTFSLNAVPAKRGLITVRQSDGTELKIQIYGDEFRHYTATEDGFTVVQDADGDYCYAQNEGGRLVASRVKAGAKLSAEEQAVALKSKGIRPARQTVLGEARAARHSENTALRAPSKAARQFGMWGGEVSGELKGVVILVNFSDKKYVIDSPKEAFSDMLNARGYSKNRASGSAVDYFIDNSTGKFTPTFDVYGPYTLPNTSKYYAGSDGTENGVQMIIDACKAADADIDFSQYAADGKVRSVFVYYAGLNQAEGGGKNTVWPHQYSVYYPQTYLDGVQIYDYACTSELSGSSGSNMAGIGTFCHEFGHVLGLPDFYDTDDSTNGTAFGLNTVSVMDYGSYLNDGRTPPAYTIMERWMLGWGEPTTIDKAGIYTLAPVYDNVGYVIETPTADEFFLLENRSKGVGNKWDYYLLNGDSSVSAGGDGMLVYHVDYSSKYKSRWNTNGINSYSNHECMKLLRAVPNAYKSGAWYYPGSGNVTQLTGTSNPSLNSWDGNAPDHLIANISQSGNDIVLSVGGTEITDIIADARQYDALLTWQSEYPEYKVVYAPANDSSKTVTLTTTECSCMLDNLTPFTSYTVTITPKESQVPYTVSFITEKRLAGQPARLNVEYRHSSSDWIRFSVENLKTTPTDIVWYVDGVKSNSYVKLASGRHTVCAVATSASGNEYLFRYISITE